MSEKNRIGAVRYLDVVSLAIGLLAAASVVLNPDRRSWTARDVLTLVALLAGCAAFASLRRGLYEQRRTGSIALYLAFLTVAMFSAFWSLPLMWLVVLAPIGALLLLAGSIAPLKRVAERVTRVELFKLVTVAGTIVMTVVVAEVFVRLVPGIFSEQTRQLLGSTPANSGLGHPYIGHLHRPSRTMEFTAGDVKGLHNMDAAGFRNRWPWPERADIVAVGDSLTFGLGVNDDRSWPAIVAASTGRQVINLGLVGASPEQYFRVYKTFGSSLTPKVLLVGFYAQNDFWDAGMFDQWVREGVGDNYMTWRNFGRPLRFSYSLRHPVATAEGVFRAHVYPLVRSSHLYNLLRAVRGGTGGGFTATSTLAFADASRLHMNPDEFLFMTAGARPDRREFRLVVDALQQIQTLATEQGARTLVVLQPSKEEVYLPLAGIAVTDPTGALREALDAAAIDYLDLLPEFRQRAEAGERLFFETDSHPNEAGYALIGHAVADHLRQNAGTYGLEE